MIDFKLVHLLLTLQLFFKTPAATNERQIGLSSLTGSALNPDNLIGAIKLASGLGKVAGVPNAVMDTTYKALEAYSPIVVPQAGEDKNEPTISLDDKQLKSYLPQERVNQLVKMAGLDSQNIDWKLFRCPLTLNQLKAIVVNQQSSSAGLSIMPMDSYLSKITHSLDRISDSYFRRMEKYMDSEMDLEDFMEHVKQLDQVEEGLVVLPVSIKSGVLQNRPGSIVLLCLGKFPPDKKLSDPAAIMPTILIGTINHASPVQLKPEPVTSAPTSTSTSNTLNESPSEPVVTNPSIIEVDESPLAEADVPIFVGSSETANNPASVPVDTITSSQSSSSSSAQAQAKVQPQPQPQFQPQPFPGPQMVSHLPPPRQGRPGRPPPPNFQPRPQPPPFDGRQPFSHQPGRPIPRPRTEG
ncbi:uncharacterized protein LOC107360487 [Tetranychus urticae]|uniref:Uncharacterized protein n=1 Tax=Tetranychus urticae TaxID=32264 RepID=T1K405_TETUR|nr:uncharacterized protein LOC107360487 [Tetranychus urticae]